MKRLAVIVGMILTPMVASAAWDQIMGCDSNGVQSTPGTIYFTNAVLMGTSVISNGVQGAGTTNAYEINANFASPVMYSPTNVDVSSHLKAVDTALATATGGVVIACTVVRTNDLAMNNNTWYRIPFNYVHDDTHSGWDNVNSVYKYPVIGRYGYSYSVMIQDVDPSKQIDVRMYHVHSGGTVTDNVLVVGYSSHVNADLSFNNAGYWRVTSTSDFSYVEARHGNGDNTPFVFGPSNTNFWRTYLTIKRR